MAWKTICDISNEEAQYRYCANGPAAVLFSCLFGLTLITHIIQAVLYHKRYCWVVIMGAAWECVGFVMRTYSTINQIESTTGSTGQLLILLAPLWINASIYLIFGRVVWYYLPEQKIGGIRAISLGKLFIWLDICAFIVQATGGIMDTGFSDQLDLIGVRIYMGGIALQEMFILYFLVLLILFRNRTRAGYADTEKNDGWRYLTPTLLAVVALISTRVIYRLIEFSLDGTSALSNNEVPFYVLEATPMLLALVLLNVFHPSRYLLGPDAEFPKKPSRKEKKAVKKEAKEQKKSDRQQTKVEKAERKAARKFDRKNGGYQMERLDPEY